LEKKTRFKIINKRYKINMFKFRPKPTVERDATEEEIKNIKKTEEMLDKEKKLPPASQMIRNLAVDHWKSLKAFVKGKEVIVPQEEAERRWEICKACPELLYDETNPDTGKKDGRCPHCGCFMNVKVHYAVAECPLEKWEKFEKK
tara:strand:+ start:1457 stop:1891 length:435 start_codon:yes stop_codon:yes gene_type:complete